LAIDDSSTLASRILVEPIDGSTTRTNITTPTPPNQCVDALQNSSPLGSASTLLSDVDPVVVKPETLSNHASASVNSPPQSM